MELAGGREEEASLAGVSREFFASMLCAVQPSAEMVNRYSVFCCGIRKYVAMQQSDRAA
jgi:hypothetical protein